MFICNCAEYYGKGETIALAIDNCQDEMDESGTGDVVEFSEAVIYEAKKLEVNKVVIYTIEA